MEWNASPTWYGVYRRKGSNAHNVGLTCGSPAVLQVISVSQVPSAKYPSQMLSFRASSMTSSRWPLGAGLVWAG